MKEFTATAVPSLSREQLMTPDKRVLSRSHSTGENPQNSSEVEVSFHGERVGSCCAVGWPRPGRDSCRDLVQDFHGTE